MGLTRGSPQKGVSPSAEALASKFAKRSTQVVSLEGPHFSRMRSTSLYGRVTQELRRLGVSNRDLRGSEEIFPRVQYNVSFFEVLSPVRGDECEVFLWNEQSIFPGWSGLLALQYGLRHIFPSLVLIFAPQPAHSPLLGKEQKPHMLALRQTEDGLWYPWVMKMDAGFVQPSTHLLHVKEHNGRR